MNEIIKVNYESERPTVLGRELHKTLEVESNYTTWFNRMADYGFIDGSDFISCFPNSESENQHGGQNKTDHQLTIEMAKEICMLQRSEKGKQARQYFIQLENAWNTPEMVMSRALKMAEVQISKLSTTVKIQDQLIGELKPKADYTDRILQNKGLVSITQIAKDYGTSGKALNDMLHKQKIQYKQGGQWLLYADYHDCGYTHSKTIDITRTNGIKDVVMETKWTQKGRLFLYDMLKQKDVLPTIER